MLEVENVSVSYGRHRALEGTSIKVGKGEICVILGANGAGKSTLLKTIAGMVHADPGSRVLMNGKPITGMKPHKIVEEGIALVPEGRGIFGDLTVTENLQLGAFAHRARRDEAETLRLIYSLFPRLAERKKQVARTMSGGEQQMVAIGRALMSKPEILMLDEPSLGLSPLLSQELFRSLAEVARTGVGILLVEQNAKQSLKIAGRGYLIENGHVTGENSAQALMTDPAVISAYLGGASKASEAARPKFALPAPMRLPASVEAMGRALGDFAARAGRISQAFVRSMRRDGPLPSAFVGRYDPTAGGDPWQRAADEPKATAIASGTAIAARAPVVAADAQRLGQQAAALAHRAGDRFAAHVRTTRLSSPRPSAFATGYDTGVPPVPRWAGASVGAVAHGGDASPALGQAATVQPARPISSAGQSIADLAARASAIHAAHIAALRARHAGSSPSRLPPVEEPPARRNGAHGLIGHNSAGIDDEQQEAAPQPAPSPGLSISDLAARAASIHAAHIAARRAALPAIEARTPPGAPEKAFEPAAVRDPVREAVPGSIGDLVTRAASIHSSHVAAERKRLAAFTIPDGASPKAGQKKNVSAQGKRKKHKEN